MVWNKLQLLGGRAQPQQVVALPTHNMEPASQTDLILASDVAVKLWRICGQTDKFCLSAAKVQNRRCTDAKHDDGHVAMLTVTVLLSLWGCDLSHVSKRLLCKSTSGHPFNQHRPIRSERLRHVDH